MGGFEVVVIVVDGVGRIWAVVDIEGGTVLGNVVTRWAAVATWENWADGKDLLNLFFGRSAVITVCRLVRLG